MLEGILTNALGGILSEVLGTVLKQPVKRIFDEYDLQRALTAAVKRAEDRFARDYHNVDAELTAVLMAQTRFADVPSVHAALKEMLTHPFEDPLQTVATLQRSFSDVLPARVDRARVDAAVNIFLQYLGEEVLYIPHLQHLYVLAFQKVSAESSRDIAKRMACMPNSRAVTPSILS